MSVTFRDQNDKYLAKKEITIVQAMHQIDINGGHALLIVDDNKTLLGSVSDGDIRRSIMKDGNLDKHVSEIMNTNPRFVMTEDAEEGVLWEEYNRIMLLPVLDENHVVTNVLVKDRDYNLGYFESSKFLRDVPVIIMAGGKGTRLYPYTKILPKPLIPIDEIPIIERIIDRYIYFGVNEFWVTINYKKNMIRSYFGDLQPKYKLNFIEENVPLGTAGSLRLIEEKFDKPIIVANCDILINADYEAIYKHHIDSESAITVVTALKRINIPYGVVYSEENSVIKSMEEKPSISYFVNTGMYVINPEFISEIPQNEMYHMPSLVDKLMKKGLKVTMYPVSENSFLDMGEFEEMRRMEEKLKHK